VVEEADEAGGEGRASTTLDLVTRLWMGTVDLPERDILYANNEAGFDGSMVKNDGEAAEAGGRGNALRAADLLQKSVERFKYGG
jgi:hypothetical protein